MIFLIVMGFLSFIGLVNPKTKAECDERIAVVQGNIERKKAYIAAMPNGKPNSSERCNKNVEKQHLAGMKEELAKLKALRKTL